MCLAQGHNTVMPMRLEPKSSTLPLRHYALGNESDCRSRDHDPGLIYTFVEIDHEIISMVIFLPRADSRRVVVSYKRK